MNNLPQAIFQLKQNEKKNNKIILRLGFAVELKR